GLVVTRVLHGKVEPPSAFAPGIPLDLDATVLQGLARKPSDRFATAREMASALEALGPLPTATEIGEWIGCVSGEELGQRAERVEQMERCTASIDPTAPSDCPISFPELNASVSRSGELVSQVTSMSVSTEVPFKRIMRRPWAIAGLGASGALVVVLTLVFAGV